MSRIKIFIISFFLSSFFLTAINSLCAQSNLSWFDISLKTSRPDTIKNLIIDFTNETNTYSNLEKYSNITHLWIKEMQNEDVEKIKDLKPIVFLIISDSPELDLNACLKSIDCNSVQELNLQGNLIENLPESIAKFKKLSKITITDNDNLNIASFIEIINSNSTLSQVDISGNRISAFPSIKQSAINIRTLNIKDNLLETCASFLNNFPNTDSLIMEGNMFADPTIEIAKLNKAIIKYVSLDSSVVFNQNWEKIKKEYANTQFNLVPDIGFAGTTYTSNNNIPDSLSFSLKQSEETNSSDSSIVGLFKLEKNTFRILSDAYIHYPRLFPTTSASFDSLLFEERFLDLSYINNIKKTRTFQRGRIQLSLGKKYSRIIHFSINTDPKYINKNYNELSVYNGTKWVYKNKDYKRSEFKKKFVGSQRKPVFWNDIKIEFDADNNEYVLVLKNDTCFFYFNCYLKKQETPFSKNKKKKTEIGSLTTEKAHLKKYLRYQKLRSTREIKVNKSIIKNMDLYQKAMQKLSNVNWLSFKQMYMSAEEKAMTKEQWLEYYEKVIANEPEAIRNSDASIDATKRSMQIEGYTVFYSAILLKDTLPIESCGLLFKDNDSNILAVKKVMIVLADRQKYITMTGTITSDYLQTILPLNEKVMFIVETVSGKIGVASYQEVEKARNSGLKQYSIPIQMLDSKIATVGQIYNILMW